jgi:hypothetical protein
MNPAYGTIVWSSDGFKISKRDFNLPETEGGVRGARPVSIKLIVEPCMRLGFALRSI